MPRRWSSTGARSTVVLPGRASAGSMQHTTSHSCVEVFAETRHEPHGATRHVTSAGSSPPARMGKN